jgi:DNA-binding response OmpR family regulator
MKILLIEDDDALINLLTRSLSDQHHIVDAVKDGEMGWTYASTFDYNLIILDIMLPKLDGISLCKKLRSEGYTIPILLLTAQDQTIAKVQGLDAGADDYVAKPFEITELIARVRALLRRGNTNSLPLLSWGDLALNPSSCDVTYDGQLLTLTTKEYDLLEMLLRDSSHVFSSDEIIDRLWSSDDFPAEATVRSHLRRLRHKLQSAGAQADIIGTIHGRGYYLKPPKSNHSKKQNISLQTGSKELPSSMINKEQSDKQQEQQYLAFLQETWVTTKPECLEHLT